MNTPAQPRRLRPSRHLPRWGASMVFAIGLVPCALADDLARGQEALRSGRYQEAIEAFGAHIETRGPDLRSYRGLIGALRETGRYREAEERARAFENARPGGLSPELLNLLGEILRDTGRLEEAEEAFRRAVAGGASDRLTAELNLSILLYDRGDHERAMRGFDRFIDVYNRSERLSSEDLTAVAVACRYLGIDDPQLFKDALKAFDEASAADPGNLEPRLRTGYLFLEKYNGADARKTFEEILAINPRHPRALLGMAQVLQFDGAPEALDLTRKALEVNPGLVPARVFLARLELGLEDYLQAGKEAEAALDVNPASVEALTVAAAARYLSGDEAGFEASRKKVLELNPRYADFYNTLADVCVQNRLYQQAVEFARQAVEVDGKSWWGYGLLGINQLRLGLIEEGKRNLERSFAGDPYNVWIKNTLDLVDTFSAYAETASDRFRVVADRKESDVLAPYVASLAEEAYDTLSKRYGYRPPTPIRIEVYPSHADFSVRTIGLAGLGALGVCFGPVVAIDSPSAREKGDFNWGSTLWHELMHTVSLGMTDHKVPRWFSEGLSVYEERRARPGWGDDVSIPFLLALKEGKLLPITDLTNGFIRPAYPQQIAISYFQASLVCELVERSLGLRGLLDMLAAYKAGGRTDEVFRAVLGCDPALFDKRLDAYMKERFATPLAALTVASDEAPARALSVSEVEARAKTAPRDFLAQLAAGQALFKEGRWDEAQSYLERAEALFPEYGGGDSPYWLLAQIHRKKGDLGKAAEELTRLVSLSDRHYEAHLDLADLRGQLGDEAGAAEILERSLYIYPLEPGPHGGLAGLYRQRGLHPKVIRERKALVALERVDRAQVLYDLALAYFEAGDRASARRELLRALEIAPTFGRALELLLKLQPGEGGGRH